MAATRSKGNGYGIRWIREHVDYRGEDCLIWPLDKEVSSLEQSEEICRDMDFDSKTCPHCCRTYGEARREEGMLFTQG